MSEKTTTVKNQNEATTSETTATSDIFDELEEQQTTEESGEQESTETQEAEGGEEQQEAGEPTKVTASSLNLSTEQFQELLSRVGGQPSQQAQEKQKDPEITPEEYDRLMNVVKPSAAHVQKILEGGEAAVQAMNELLQGAARQAVTMTNYQLQVLEDRLKQQLNPLLAQQQAAQTAALKQEFFSEHKDLADFEPVVLAVRQQLIDEQYKAPDKKTAFAEVAKRSRAILAKLKPKEGTTTQQQPQKKMPTTLKGGQAAGGSGQKVGNGANSEVADIFG